MQLHEREEQFAQRGGWHICVVRFGDWVDGPTEEVRALRALPREGRGRVAAPAVRGEVPCDKRKIESK